MRKPIQMHADVGGFCSRIGERDCAIERLASFAGAAYLHQQATFDAEEMKITGEPVLQRLDQRQRFGGTSHLRDGDRAVERDDG